MTKGELSKGVALRLITAVVFGLIGTAAIYYALQMVAIFGEGMGVDARSREIYAHSHMVVHLFGAACALAIGVFHQSGNKLLRALAVLAILACGGYGILNMVGFTSTNRVAVAAAKDARNAGAERQYQSARTDLAKQIEWLQKTAAQEEGRERRRLLSEVDAKRKELSGLKAPVATAETVLSDPQASTLAELTGTDTRKWLLALPVPLAILLFFAESFSFVAVGHMLSGAVSLFVTYNSAQQSASDTGNSGSGGGGKSKDQDQKQPDTRKVMQADTGKVVPLKKTADDTDDTVNYPHSVSAIQPTQRSLEAPVETKRPARKSRAEVISILEQYPDDLLDSSSQRTWADRLGTSQPMIHRARKDMRGKKALKELRGRLRKQDFRNPRPFVHGGQVSLSG